MDADNPLLRFGWPMLAAFAGAVTALSFRLWQTMNWTQILFSLFVGASFATFMGPMVAKWVLGTESSDYRMYGALLYIMATGSNVLIPWCVKKLFGVEPGGTAP